MAGFKCHVCQKEIPPTETSKTFILEGESELFVVACWEHSTDEVYTVPVCYICGKRAEDCDKKAEETGFDECEWLAGK